MEQGLGDVAAGLLRELKQSSGQGGTCPYNDAQVKKVIQEVQWLWHQNKAIIEANPDEMADEKKIALYANHRNKRCLMAYLQDRIERARTLCWEAGMTIPS